MKKILLALVLYFSFVGVVNAQQHQRPRHDAKPPTHNYYPRYHHYPRYYGPRYIVPPAYYYAPPVYPYYVPPVYPAPVYPVPGFSFGFGNKNFRLDIQGR